MGDICVLAIVRIVADLLFLSLQDFNEIIKLSLRFIQLLSFLLNLRVLFAKTWRHKIDGIWQFIKSASDTLSCAAAHVFSSVRPWALATVDCSGSVPTNIVLAFFCNEADAFKDICNIIDTSFLNIEGFYCIVEVQSLIRRFFQQINKLFGQLNQSIFFAPATVSFV